MQKRYRPMFVALWVVLAGTVAPLAQAAVPSFGAWRNLDSRNGAERALDNVPFALLPADAAPGSRYAIFDRESQQLVCCLQVVSAALDDEALKGRYQLPDESIDDLRNARSTHRPWETHVFEMRREDALASHAFSDAARAYSDMGGLMVPEGTRLLPGDVLDAAGERWQLQFSSRPLGDDSSTLDRYTLRPLAGEGAPAVIEVSFGTY